MFFEGLIQRRSFTYKPKKGWFQPTFLSFLTRKQMFPSVQESIHFWVFTDIELVLRAVCFEPVIIQRYWLVIALLEKQRNFINYTNTGGRTEDSPVAIHSCGLANVDCMGVGVAASIGLATSTHPPWLTQVFLQYVPSMKNLNLLRF